MSAITIAYGLPFVEITLFANNQNRTLNNVLLDTGSAASVFKIDDLNLMGATLQPTDQIQFMSGIGGREAIVEKTIDGIQLGSLVIRPFPIQIGVLAYGFSINGILGADFLFRAGAKIDFGQLQVR